MVGYIWAGWAFLMTGPGMTQTAGLALAADRASVKPAKSCCFVICNVFNWYGGISSNYRLPFARFSNLRLIQVIQGTAVFTLLLDLIALWKQETLSPIILKSGRRLYLRLKAWRIIIQVVLPVSYAVVAVGTLAFSMQDVLLEPYGGEILGLSVSSTTMLTASWALGALLGFLYAANALRKKEACNFGNNRSWI